MNLQTAYYDGLPQYYKNYLSAVKGMEQNLSLDALCEEVTKRIAFMIDTKDAVGKIAELKNLIDSI